MLIKGRVKKRSSALANYKSACENLTKTNSI